LNFGHEGGLALQVTLLYIVFVASHSPRAQGCAQTQFIFVKAKVLPALAFSILSLANEKANGCHQHHIHFLLLSALGMGKKIARLLVLLDLLRVL
jgi:hypothetical protein